MLQVFIGYGTTQALPNENSSHVCVHIYTPIHHLMHINVCHLR